MERPSPPFQKLVPREARIEHPVLSKPHGDFWRALYWEDSLGDTRSPLCRKQPRSLEAFARRCARHGHVLSSRCHRILYVACSGFREMHATGAMVLLSGAGDHFAFHLVHFAFLERMQFCFARWVCQKNSRRVCVLIIDARRAGGFHLCCYPFSSSNACYFCEAHSNV